MLKNIAALILVFILYPATAFCFDVSVSPGTIRQGDVFVVRIKSGEIADPYGIVGKNKINFHMTSPGNYIGLSSTGIEQPPGNYNIRVHLGNETKTVRIHVRAIKSKKILIQLPDDKVTLSPEDERRAENEISIMRAKWLKRTGHLWHGRFSPPLETAVSTKFGILRIINGHKKSIHKGVDYRGRRGMRVKAINSGVVSLTGRQFFGGNTVMIDHGDGIFSIYMHLDKILVKEGQRINRSDVIGLVGSTGRATGPHLHLTVKWEGLTVNPLSLFSLPL
ncbi:murein DD-endopeptidase MepM [bacterium BMS3Abin07]|nr:murein DD-endopeptidase MepM [bacterium BMS3Abin07]GBE33219.1 murein DD-endopeptidase MepM [bacterium BMS3Bbin05]HDO22767.1 M23 family metallopeptidase [Nitrospirota bacterium]HDZ87514.1 M23 family metallopeptidase [Nitrospirota bacterium]